MDGIASLCHGAAAPLRLLIEAGAVSRSLEKEGRAGREGCSRGCNQQDSGLASSGRSLRALRKDKPKPNRRWQNAAQ